VTDGNSEEAARGGDSDEEAAWLDLIGRFDAPAGTPDAPSPWPDRENLGPPERRGGGTTSGNMPQRGPGDRTAPGDGLGEPRLGEHGLDEGGPEEHRLGEHRLDEHRLGEHGPGERRGPGEHGPGERRGPGADGPGDGGGRDSERWSSVEDHGPWQADTDATWPPTDTDGPWPAADADGTATGRSTRWPSAGDATAAGEDPAGEGPGTGLLPDAGPAADGRFVLPGHRSVDLPSPAGPRSWSAPDEDDDEGHYTPPPPPPLPALAPGQKAAWTGLFGGPGYLLVATLAGWSVPGWALFLAIAAFVGGFTVLVLRQGDRPDDDSGPDDGAVV
jgi:hypothetical protein